MKRIILFPLLLASCLYGQEKKFSVTGQISDCLEKQPLANVRVKLIGSDNSSRATVTDSSGSYSFTDFIKRNTDYILTATTPDGLGQSKAVKYGICPGEYRDKIGYLNSSETFRFSFKDSLSDIKHDFCFTPIVADYIFPTIYFSKNSAAIDYSAYREDKVDTDTTFDCFVSLLQAKETWVIELSAHSASDEINKKKLAEARCKKIYDLMVAKGIDKERIVCNAFADKYPYEFKNENGKVIKEESKAVLEKSRRVAFSVLRKDYNPITKKPKIDPPKEKSSKEFGEEE